MSTIPAPETAGLPLQLPAPRPPPTPIGWGFTVDSCKIFRNPDVTLVSAPAGRLLRPDDDMDETDDEVEDETVGTSAGVETEEDIPLTSPEELLSV